MRRLFIGLAVALLARPLPAQVWSFWARARPTVDSTHARLPVYVHIIHLAGDSTGARDRIMTRLVRQLDRLGYDVLDTASRPQPDEHTQDHVTIDMTVFEGSGFAWRAVAHYYCRADEAPTRHADFAWYVRDLQDGNAWAIDSDVGGHVGLPRIEAGMLGVDRRCEHGPPSRR